MTIDAELSVGALEETVTVSGASPVVDVQTTARSEVLNREILDAVPTGNNLQSTAQLIVGVKLNRPEVGLTTAAQQTYMSVHGMSPSQVTVQVDGQNVNNLGGDGAVQNYHNHLASEEMVYETSGMTAETSGGGVRVNMIPRQGGNTVSGQSYFGGSIDQFQADGLEAVKPRTLERGVAALEGFSMMYDLNVALGGPIVRDKFWYFGSIRNWQIDKKITNQLLPDHQRRRQRGPLLQSGPGPARRPGRPRARAGHRRQHDHQRAAAFDVAGQRHQQVHREPRPGVQEPLPPARREHRHRFGGRVARVADLLHVDRQVDLHHQQPAAVRGGLLVQRRELGGAGLSRDARHPQGAARRRPALLRHALLSRRPAAVRRRDGSVVSDHHAAGHRDRVQGPVPLGRGVQPLGEVQLPHLDIVRHGVAQHEDGHHERFSAPATTSARTTPTSGGSSTGTGCRRKSA